MSLQSHSLTHSSHMRDPIATDRVAVRVVLPGAALLQGARSLKSSQTFSSRGGLGLGQEVIYGLGLADWSRDSSVCIVIRLRDE